jgi:hypothetical protein
MSKSETYLESSLVKWRRVRRRRRLDALPQELTSEFLSTALSTAVTTNMVMARVQKRKLRLQTAVGVYFPKPPLLFKLFTQANPDANRSNALVGAIGRIYSRLEYAMAMTPLQCEPWISGSADPGLWESLSVVWTPLCGTIRSTLLDLENTGSARVSDTMTRLIELNDLLDASRHGETPCILHDGLTIIPGLHERRSERRISVGISVSIEFGCGIRRAVLRDFSATGAGLTGAPKLPLGTRVAIRLPNGQQLVGQSMWCHEGSLGIRFNDRHSVTETIFADILRMRAGMRGAT